MPLIYPNPPVRYQWQRRQPQMEGPLDWITTAAKTVAHGVEAGAKGIVTGAKYAGKGVVTGVTWYGKTLKKIGGYALVVAKDERTWQLAVLAAGTYFGIPPQVTLAAMEAFKKTGKVPPGTDPRLAEYIEQSKPKDYTPYYIAGGVGGLLLLLLLLRRRD